MLWFSGGAFLDAIGAINAAFAADAIAEQPNAQPQTGRTESRTNSMADRSPILASHRDRNLGPGEYLFL